MDTKDFYVLCFPDFQKPVVALIQGESGLESDVVRYGSLQTTTNINCGS